MAYGRARNAVLSGEIIDSRNLRTDDPLPGLDPATKQGRQLQIARNRASLKVDDLLGRRHPPSHVSVVSDCSTVRRACA